MSELERAYHTAAGRRTADTKTAFRQGVGCEASRIMVAKTVADIAIDGIAHAAQPDELLINLINRIGVSVPHVCYHPQLGPVQTCDTCMVEVNGRLVRACATEVADGMKISTKSATASAAQVEAFDRILSNHLLYCTVCDNNNGNCTVHNTTKLLAIEHQRIPFRSKPYEVDSTNPF